MFFHFQYLHSSMERLKAVAAKCALLAEVTFTFQYGEIKSTSRAGIRKRLREFTFQYGEIKSFVTLRYRGERYRIYIPVWRD